MRSKLCRFVFFERIPQRYAKKVLSYNHSTTCSLIISRDPPYQSGVDMHGLLAIMCWIGALVSAGLLLAPKCNGIVVHPSVMRNAVDTTSQNVLSGSQFEGNSKIYTSAKTPSLFFAFKSLAARKSSTSSPKTVVKSRKESQATGFAANRPLIVPRSTLESASNARSSLLRQVLPSVPRSFDPADIPRTNADTYAFNLEFYTDPTIPIKTTVKLIRIPPQPSYRQLEQDHLPTHTRTTFDTPPLFTQPGYYSWTQESDRNVQLSPCRRSNCAARVTITSERFIRSQVIRKAHQRIRRLPNFNSVYIVNNNFRIFRKGKKTFVVIIQFKKRYLDQIQHLIP